MRPALRHQHLFVQREKPLFMEQLDPCGAKVFITAALRITSQTFIQD